MRPISSRGSFFLNVVVISASMKLSAEIFAVQHSPYPVSKFELGRPSKHGENGWEHFFVTNKNMNMKKDNENSRPLKASKLGSRLMRTLGIHGGYQCVAQLSLIVELWCSFGPSRSRLAMALRRMFSIRGNWPEITWVIPKYTVLPYRVIIIISLYPSSNHST